MPSTLSVNIINIDNVCKLTVNEKKKKSAYLFDSSLFGSFPVDIILILHNVSMT